MPFTPFHLGPGVAFKSVAPGHYSLSVFVFTQIVIDLEPLFYMLSGEWPVHRFLHTYLGATVAAFIGYWIGRPVCGVVLTMIQHRARSTRKVLSNGMNRINQVAAFSGAFIGAYSHVALDSIMHSDLNPLAPFSKNNGLLKVIPVAELYLYCTVAGIAGVIGLGFWWLIWREKSDT
jgi:hypothetical protein